MNLNEITSELGTSYQAWKDDEKNKEKKRKEFFDAATEEHKKKTLARKTIRVAADTKEDAWEIASRYHSKWKILDVYIDDPDNPDGWTVTLEEDPNLKDFVWINSKNGFVYTKSISDTGAIIDIERIQKEEPDFWEQISFSVELDAIWDFIGWLDLDLYYLEEPNVDPDTYAAFQKFKKLFKRELKPLEKLSSEQFFKLQKYTYKPKPQVKLLAPRKARPEELENV